MSLFNINYTDTLEMPCFVPMLSSGARYGKLGSKEWHFTRVKSYRNDRKVPFFAPEEGFGTTRR